MSEYAEQPASPEPAARSSSDSLDRQVAETTAGASIVEYVPAEKIGGFTVFCLVVNKTLGSGLFVISRSIVLATHSTGWTLILWVIGAIGSLANLMVWLELGMSTPRVRIPGEREKKSIPRSGGDKNYFEYMWRKPKFLATCFFGIPFIILGNLSGNAIQFGRYVMQAASSDPLHNPDSPGSSKREIYACAVAALTAACLIHVFSRRGGIILSNCFAIYKLALMISIIVVCSIYKIQDKNQDSQQDTIKETYLSQLKPDQSFSTASARLSNYATSLLYIYYSFAGYDQPFFVLSEVRHPRKTFPRATILGLVTMGVFYFFVNLSYIHAFPSIDYLSFNGTLSSNGTLNSNVTLNFNDTHNFNDDQANDMTVFLFAKLFPNNTFAPRLVAGLIAANIFGGIVVMTFTASRVKQEIAKEGILPFTNFLASGMATLDDWLRRNIGFLQRSKFVDKTEDKSPMAALFLHWLISVMLLLPGASKLKPTTVYFALVFLHSYVLVIIMPLAMTLLLLYWKFSPNREWHCDFRPWGGPMFAIINGIVCTFLLVTVFLPPNNEQPYSRHYTAIVWYILPLIGLSSVFWGPAWWLGLKFIMWKTGRDLVVKRIPIVIRKANDDELQADEWEQKGDAITREWKVKTLRQDSIVSEAGETAIIYGVVPP